LVEADQKVLMFSGRIKYGGFIPYIKLLLPVTAHMCNGIEPYRK